MAQIFDGSASDGTKHAWELEQAPPNINGTPVEPGDRVRVVPAASIFPGSGRLNCIRHEYRIGDAEIPSEAGKRAELQPKEPYRPPPGEYWLEWWINGETWNGEQYVLTHQLHEAEPPTGVAVGAYLEGGKLKLKPGKGLSWWETPFELGKPYYLLSRVVVSETVGQVEVWRASTGSGQYELQTLTNGKTKYENVNTLSPCTEGGGTKTVYEKQGINQSRSLEATAVIYTSSNVYTSKPALKGGAMELWPAADEQKLLLASPGAETTSSTGIQVAENATENPYKLFNCGEERGSSGFGGTPLPNANPGVGAAKDTLWTPEALTKKFKAGNWMVNWKVIATAGTGGKGRVRCKLWKSPDKSTAFTALGEAQALGEASLVIGEAKATALTFALEGAALNNEYLGIQIAWQITAKATGATSNVRLRKGAEVKLTTPEEEAAEPATGRSSFGFRRDSKHRLITKPSGTGRRKEGFARTTAGSLCTVTTGAARVVNGLQVDSSGRVVISTGAIAKVREGLPRDSAGKLVTSAGTVTHTRNGFGLDSGGKVVVVEGA